MLIKKNRTDQAVSPVIGVLLMLVVTIIIAAVVSGFAGSLAGTEKAAPTASISVEADSSDGLIMFKHLGGDTLDTKDLEIITYYTNRNGDEFRNSTTKTSPPAEVYAGGSYEWPEGSGTIITYSGAISRVPFLNNMPRTGGMENYVAWFGNFTFGMGDVMSTYGNYGTSTLLGCNASTSQNFTSGDLIDMKIKHIPSGKLIFDKEVSVK